VGVIPAGARCTAVPLRVRFGETDAMGIANNAAYLAWFEVGRVEYLRELGHSYAEVHAGGMDMVVVEAHAEYLRALRFDDQFTVRCACTEVRGASFTFGYELVRGDELACRGFTRHACVNRDTMRAVRVPGWLREAASRGSTT
jgi:acyl-CoA thioester hydrolase